jgi:hypothetical protein
MAFDKIKNMTLPAPPPQLTNSVGQAPLASPPSPGAPPPDFSDIISKKPKRGGLPLDLIASIQKSYTDEAQKNTAPNKAQPQSMGLEPGWGGKGR